MPKVAVRPLRHTCCCFPHASPVSQTKAGKQKAALSDRYKSLILFRKPGAGEGIRTLDPNLGKVQPPGVFSAFVGETIAEDQTVTPTPC